MQLSQREKLGKFLTELIEDVYNNPQSYITDDKAKQNIVNELNHKVRHDVMGLPKTIK